MLRAEKIAVVAGSAAVVAAGACGLAAIPDRSGAILASHHQSSGALLAAETQQAPKGESWGRRYWPIGV